MMINILRWRELLATLEKQWIVDRDGNRTGVILSIEAYEAMLDDLEMQDDVRAYDEARPEGGPKIPWEQVKQEIEREKGWTTE